MLRWHHVCSLRWCLLARPTKRESRLFMKAEYMYEAQFHSIRCIKKHYVTETYWRMSWRTYATINWATFVQFFGIFFLPWRTFLKVFFQEKKNAWITFFVGLGGDLNQNLDWVNVKMFLYEGSLYKECITCIYGKFVAKLIYKTPKRDTSCWGGSKEDG